MQICGHCGYERKEKDSILDSRSCPRCGIVYHKWQERALKGEPFPSSVMDHDQRKYVHEAVEEHTGRKRPFVKYLAALSLVMFVAIVVMSVLVMYKSQNPYSVMSQHAIALALAGIVIAILALTGVSRYGATGIVAPAILGIVFNVGWIAIADPVLGKITTDEYKLERAAAAADRLCPFVVRDTRFNAFYFEPANKITMSVTLLKIAWKDLPGYGRDDIMDQAKAHVIEQIRQDEKLYRFYRKVDWTCIIKTSDDVEYLRVRIRPSDFG